VPRVHWEGQPIWESKDPNGNYATAMTLLMNSSVFRGLRPEHYVLCATSCLFQSFEVGEVVYWEGGPSRYISIISQGDAMVSISDDVNGKQFLMILQRGDCIGKSAMQAEATCAATVTAASKLQCVCIPKNIVQLLVQSGEMTLEVAEDDLRRYDRALDETFRWTLSDLDAQQKSPEKPKLADMQKIGLLGVGCCGRVDLVEHVPTGETYALKRVGKGSTVKNGRRRALFNEKHTLALARSPFVIGFFGALQDEQAFYFLNEPALGGELYTVYKNNNFHGSLFHAKFYLACITCALEHLHERHILCRGVKPEDCVLGLTGHPKLVDFGMSKLAIAKTYTVWEGTPEYIPPEVIEGSGHHFGCDWWSLGIMAYELMTGHTPFEADYPMQVHAKIRRGIEEVDMPPDLAGQLSNLIKGLLKRKPTERLPMLKGGVDNLKNHDWYLLFDWSALLRFKLAPPFRPKIAGSRDLQNFQPFEDDAPLEIPYEHDGSTWVGEF